jgi:hypothetical protein
MIFVVMGAIRVPILFFEALNLQQAMIRRSFFHRHAYTCEAVKFVEIAELRAPSNSQENNHRAERGRTRSDLTVVRSQSVRGRQGDRGKPGTFP